MEFRNEFLAKLAYIASAATHFRLKSDALMIMEGLHAVRADNPDVHCSLAIAKVNAASVGDDLEDAIYMIEREILPADPSNAVAKCFLGIGLQKAGRLVEGEQLLRESLESEDESCRLIAQNWFAETPNVFESGTAGKTR